MQFIFLTGESAKFLDHVTSPSLFLCKFGHIMRPIFSKREGDVPPDTPWLRQFVTLMLNSLYLNIKYLLLSVKRLMMIPHSLLAEAMLIICILTKNILLWVSVISGTHIYDNDFNYSSRTTSAVFNELHDQLVSLERHVWLAVSLQQLSFL